MTRLILLLLFLFPLTANGSECPKTEPGERSFYSQNKRFVLQVVRGKQATFYETRQNKRRRIWQSPFYRLFPEGVFISDEGRHVVALNAQVYPLVIYNHQGKPVSKIETLGAVLSPDEIEKAGRHPCGYVDWFRDADYTFEKEAFVLRLRWGKTIRLDLE